MEVGRGGGSEQGDGVVDELIAREAVDAARGHQARDASEVQAPTTADRGATISGVRGGILKDNPVGPAVYVDFLPRALATGAYRAEPQATIVGRGLEAIPTALERVRSGISAGKYVVTL